MNMNTREQSTPPSPPLFSLCELRFRFHMRAYLQKQFLSSKAGKVGLGTILFIFCSLLGLGGAVFVFYHSPLVYQSEAKLLIRYVLDRSAVDEWKSTLHPAREEERKQIVASEGELLASADLAASVVKSIGIQRLAPSNKPKETPFPDAVAVVRRGLQVRFPQDSTVIHISFSHSDPILAPEVLKQLIDHYFEMHLCIHRSTGEFESLARQTDQSRSRLSQTEAELEQTAEFEKKSEYEKAELRKATNGPDTDGLLVRSLKRRHALEEKAYARNEAKLETARVDEALNSRTMPNISYIQLPSRAEKTHDLRTMRSVLGLAAGGPLLGLILAFGCRLGRRVFFRSASPVSASTCSPTSKPVS